VIDFRRMGVTYPDASAPVLRDVTLNIAEGELCLVVGGTGSGKSTLLGTVNGLVPHFTGGTLSGRVTVAGRSTQDHAPRDLADVVGVVGQDPRGSFVADVVENELAYTMESLALPPDVMRRRVEDTLDLLGLAELRHRAVSTLSGGEAQRVAIGAVLGAHPRVLVLDEPTSALDPAAAEDVLAALQRLVHDLGMTVLMAEHRLERVVQYADSVVWLPGGGGPIERGTPGDIMGHSPIAPPVVELARTMGWAPLPLTVRDARRSAAGLRETLPARPVLSRVAAAPGDVVASGQRRQRPLRLARRRQRGRPDGAGRRNRRSDGPQRRGQVQPVRRADRTDQNGERPGHSRRRGPPRAAWPRPDPPRRTGAAAAG